MENSKYDTSNNLFANTNCASDKNGIFIPFENK